MPAAAGIGLQKTFISCNTTVNKTMASFIKLPKTELL
jgi:hypothetical protein